MAFNEENLFLTEGWQHPVNNDLRIDISGKSSVETNVLLPEEKNAKIL